MKYNLETVEELKTKVSPLLSFYGEVRSRDAVRMAKDKGMAMANSTLSNLFHIIMDEMVNQRRAVFICNGRWNILLPIAAVEKKDTVYHLPYENKGPLPEEVIYGELKKVAKLGDKSFNKLAITMCADNGISIDKLVNYINNAREENKHRR